MTKLREAPDERYVREVPKNFFGEPVPEEKNRAKIENLDGVSWLEAPVPSKLHSCWTQTRGWVNDLTRVRRCPCGAISLDGGPWFDRNRTKRARKRTFHSPQNRK